MTILTAARSYAGGRAANQDALLTAESGGLSAWVLADGLGGHHGGAEAARLACEAFAAGFRRFAECSPEAMLTYIGMANRAVREAQKKNAVLSDMRSTLAAMLVSGNQAVAGHIGDSRIYHLRGGALHSQSRDHSLVQAMVDAGDLDGSQQAWHPDRNRLLRCLGESDDAKPSVSEEPLQLQPGDAFVLCTDGFWEHLSAREMEADLAKAETPESWLAAMLARVRRRAMEDAGRKADNYSAIAALLPPGNGHAGREAGAQ